MSETSIDARRAALIEAAKAQCYLCAQSPEGENPFAGLSEFDSVTQRYYHRSYYGAFYNSGYCRANEIRLLTETDEERRAANRTESEPSTPLTPEDLTFRLNVLGAVSTFFFIPGLMGLLNPPHPLWFYFGTFGTGIAGLALDALLWHIFEKRGRFAN